jgi:hypothetical protein
LYDYTAADPRINDREDFGSEGVHDVTRGATWRGIGSRS